MYLFLREVEELSKELPFRDWHTDEILKQIQANIFKPHARRNAWYLFFSFSPIDGQLLGIRKRIKSLALDPTYGFTSGYDQKKAAERYREKGIDGGTITGLGFTKKGYQMLNPNPAEAVTDEAFSRGLSSPNTTPKLAFPSPDNWEEKNWRANYQQISMVVLLADECATNLAERSQYLKEFLQKEEGISYLFTEKGQKLGGEKESYEPFGFKDGISDPPFWHQTKYLRKDYLKLMLDSQFGSYMVFLKFSQDVTLFNELVDKLTKELFPETSSAEEYLEKKAFVEAQIIGRYKNGDPLIEGVSSKESLSATAQKERQRRIERFNRYHQDEKYVVDFGDDHGGKCPFHAHIRKMNPRNKTKLEDPPPKYKDHGVEVDIRIARRGTPYQEKLIRKGEVVFREGLLFVSYQASIVLQFEEIVKRWANNPTFPAGPYDDTPGIDPIIGRSGVLEQETNYNWIINPVKGDTQKAKVNFQKLVTLLGGEYFYTPGRPWFEKLDRTILSQNLLG